MRIRISEREIERAKNGSGVVERKIVHRKGGWHKLVFAFDVNGTLRGLYVYRQK